MLERRGGEGSGDADLKLTFCTMITGGGIVPQSGNENDSTCRTE